MSILNALERKFGRFAVPQVTVAIVICQVVVFFAAQVMNHGPRAGDPVTDRLTLVPESVLQGEVWRLATFLLVPPFSNPVSAFFYSYLFYLMGTALEVHWGTFRFNVYLLLGYLATVATSFLVPGLPTSNAFLEASVFLAFAYLFPDFELCLFFLLPVKIKWLALLTWISLGGTLLFGTDLSRWLVLATVGNFFIFFGKEILQRMLGNRRRMAMQIARLTEKEPPYYHRCTVCGITDRTHRTMDFRYCSKCTGTVGYCMDHLHNHEHITTGRSSVSPPQS